MHMNGVGKEASGHPKEASKEARAQGTTLPDNWTPSQADEAYGQELGLTREQIADHAEDMRLWAGANANRAVARKADWSATFKKWMRREAKGGYRANGGARPHDKGYAELASDLYRKADDERALPPGTSERAAAASWERAANSWMEDIEQKLRGVMQ
jgi:hypothetical protein